MNKLYPIPINFNQLMKKNFEVTSIPLTSSIAQNCYLIITSKFQEHRFDNLYGCLLWDKDFELITNTLLWEEEIGESILKSLLKYENRLEKINVSSKINEEVGFNPISKINFIKKRIIITINAIIKSSGLPFIFSPQLFLSPISLD